MMDFEEFRVHGKQMVDYICDYVKTLDKRQVAPTIEPGYLAPLLPSNFQFFFLLLKFKILI